MGQKISKKRVFRGFRHYFRKTLHKLTVLHRLGSKLQGIRLFDCKRCANNKIDNFSWKKKQVLGQKASKKWFFGVFRHYFRQTLSKLAVIIRLSSKLQVSRLFDWKRCANNKIDLFGWKKIRFWAKKFRRNGFFGVFDITSGKRCANLLYCSD